MLGSRWWNHALVEEGRTNGKRRRTCKEIFNILHLHALFSPIILNIEQWMAHLEANANHCSITDRVLKVSTVPGADPECLEMGLICIKVGEWGSLCWFYYPHAFLKKRRGYCNRLRPSVRPSITLSPPKPLEEIQPNLVCELLIWMGCATAYFFWPRPLGPWGGAKSSNIIKYH